MAAGHGGPAKGPGCGKPPLTPEQMAMHRHKGTRAAQIKREWRKAHPEWQDTKFVSSKKQLREYLSGLAPDAIDKLQAIICDDKNPKQAEVALRVLEQIIGRPAVTVENTDGENALQVVVVNGLRDRSDAGE